MTLNTHFATLLNKRESTGREEVEHAWLASWKALRDAEQEGGVASRLASRGDGACHASMLASSLSARAGRPSSAAASSNASTTSLMERLSAVRQRQLRGTGGGSASISSVAFSGPSTANTSSSASSGNSAGSIGVASCGSSCSSGGMESSECDVDAAANGIVNNAKGRLGKTASLRLLVKGTPEQQTARALHQAERSLQSIALAPLASRAPPLASSWKR